MLTLLPALVTALTVFLLLFTAFKVGQARGKHSVKAPAISGHPDFERAWRVQMNTLEASVMFLPSLWLAGHFGNPGIAGILGLLWLLARIWYAAAYLRDAARRHMPFTIGLLLTVMLAAWGLIAVLHDMWLLAAVPHVG
ncbi:MAPEG family protein [Oleiagrimonas soli]|nr:MAPEG family protein [Oleiagrimonas soli]MBB6182865.1 putative MAPEG superfamily protein [Oleiagrimonas soli]